MVHRKFWKQALLRQWKQRSIVWLSGVRRAGKTTLARTMASACIVTPHVPTPHNVRIGAHAVPVLDLAGLAARLDPQQAWM